MAKLTNKKRNAIAARAVALWLDKVLGDDDCHGMGERPTVGEATEWIAGIISTRSAGNFRRTRPKGAGAEALWVAWMFESGRHTTVTGLMMLSGDARKVRCKGHCLARAMWKHRLSIVSAARNSIADIKAAS